MPARVAGTLTVTAPATAQTGAMTATVKKDTSTRRTGTGTNGPEHIRLFSKTSQLIKNRTSRYPIEPYMDILPSFIITNRTL